MRNVEGDVCKLADRSYDPACCGLPRTACDDCHCGQTKCCAKGAYHAGAKDAGDPGQREIHIEGYERWLDLSTGTANSSFAYPCGPDGRVCKRTSEAFVSAVDQVMVIRHTCEPDCLTLTVKLAREGSPTRSCTSSAVNQTTLQCPPQSTGTPPTPPGSGPALLHFSGATDMVKPRSQQSHGPVGLRFHTCATLLVDDGPHGAIRASDRSDHIALDGSSRASASTLLVATATSFRLADPGQTCVATLQAAVKAYTEGRANSDCGGGDCAQQTRDASGAQRQANASGYWALRDRHVNDFGALFNTVAFELDLGHEPITQAPNLTTGMATNVTKGHVQPAMTTSMCTKDSMDWANASQAQAPQTSAAKLKAAVELYQFGRYMLLSSSRVPPGERNPLPTMPPMMQQHTPGERKPLVHGQQAEYGHGDQGQHTAYGRAFGTGEYGAQPANLQGLWADGLTSTWSGDYHMNINLQMNYWGAEAAGIGRETVEPLVPFMQALAASGRTVAADYYNISNGGWVAHGFTDIWLGAHPAVDTVWSLCPTCGVWQALTLWDRWEFGQDVTFLASVLWPLLTGAVKFFAAYLTRGKAVETGKDVLLAGPSHSPENAFMYSETNNKSGVSGNRRWAFLTAATGFDNALLFKLFQSVEDAAAVLVPPDVEDMGGPRGGPRGSSRGARMLHSLIAERAGVQLRERNPLGATMPAAAARAVARQAKEMRLSLPNGGLPIIDPATGAISEYPYPTLVQLETYTHNISNVVAADTGHRHWSGLFSLYPGHQVPHMATLAGSSSGGGNGTGKTTGKGASNGQEYKDTGNGHGYNSTIAGADSHDADLVSAARRAVETKVADDGGHTGWSQAWLSNLWARLGDGDRAYSSYETIMREYTVENNLGLHPPLESRVGKTGFKPIDQRDRHNMRGINSQARAHQSVETIKAGGGRTSGSRLITKSGQIFQIDANLGAMAAVNEMLIQSHGRLPWHAYTIPQGAQANANAKQSSCVTFPAGWCEDPRFAKEVRNACPELCNVAARDRMPPSAAAWLLSLGEVRLLAALPTAWHAGGHVTGLRARQGVVIDSLEWTRGRISHVAFHWNPPKQACGLPGRVRIRVRVTDASGPVRLHLATSCNAHEGHVAASLVDPVSIVVHHPDEHRDATDLEFPVAPTLSVCHLGLFRVVLSPCTGG